MKLDYRRGGWRGLVLLLTGVLLTSWPWAASAHGFGALYNLPVPLWLYNWSAAAALVLSFVVAAAVLSGHSQTPRAGLDISHTRIARLYLALLPWMQLLALAVLLLCLATGYWGNRDPVRNFSMTFFWIIFSLLLTYLCALLGNLYAALNPWRGVALVLGRLWTGYTRGRYTYPAALGDWPAVVLYLGFIWFELFGHGRPRELTTWLAAYSLLNVVGVWLIGARSWFSHCEFFAVFFRLVGVLGTFGQARLAQDSDPRSSAGLILRWPTCGVLHQRPAQFSTLVFVLAMLSTTAFDGLTATQWWVSLFWSDPTGLFTQWLGVPPVQALGPMRPWWLAWQSFWLLVSPFVYLGAYVLAIALAKRLTGSARPLRQLCLDFAFTLLPIVVAYHFTHYATLVLNHGLKIISLISDPFGWRWDLFGTAMRFRAPILPDMGLVWHTQVGVILLGHVLSVWLAHRVALRVFASRRTAILSQVPMLVLMVGLTVAGLWILAQPLTMMKMG